MASFIGSLMRLMVQRKARPGLAVPTDEESAINANKASSGVSAAMSSDAALARIPLPRNGRSYLIPTDAPLTMFRLMVGIVTSDQLGFTVSSPVGTRPAANIGLYARVVHSEQNAKDSFKVFSAIVNACYFFQIVVAAGLTAMSAGGAARGAITTFGAINTVIAGFLTFLKGSGLPGRLKYYGNEWKKIREYIEQRERDFAREGCTLDVYEIVETIEKMYSNTKQDIEMNTPDSYTSVANQKQLAQGPDSKIGGIEVSKLEGIASKLKGLDGTIEKLAAGVHKKAHDVTDDVREREKEIEKEGRGVGKAVAREVEEHKARLERDARERQARLEHEATERQAQASKAAAVGRQELERAKDSAARTGDTIVDEATETGAVLAREGMRTGDEVARGVIRARDRVAREATSVPERAAEDARTAAARELRRAADVLDDRIGEKR
ncbi:hypothetical protein DL764_009096 [Monosporascus ibericus]|uniref:SMODS and SLOG-associating 2TM effector domain-containing protein n=1 Tax=Monosporascus ibericus TaxID=155417 RepID=A0A4Q4SVU8_9PEZI|nr:hypothetical protein DL764_009096 [Monosporascus ibericus]